MIVDPADLDVPSTHTVLGRKPTMIPISLQPRADGVTIKDTFAEYTLVDNVFTTPLLLASRAGQRMHRLDERAFHWSPISTDAWSPSGASTSERPQE